MTTTTGTAMTPAAGTAMASTTRGRPRDPACDQAILQATIELIADGGYDRTTVDAVAARAGVSKPTIYRRWPEGKEQLVWAAVAHCHDSGVTVPDTGSLRGDLVELVERLIGGMREHAHLAAGLTQRLRESPQLAEVFRSQIVAAERRRFLGIVERAVDRGELPAVPEGCALVADLAPAIVHSRELVTGDALDGRFVRQLVDRVLLPALGAR